MTNNNARQVALQHLIEDDAVGQLRRRDGLMATLGREDGVSAARGSLSYPSPRCIRSATLGAATRLERV